MGSNLFSPKTSLPLTSMHLTVTMFCQEAFTGEFIVVSLGVSVDVGSFAFVERIFDRIFRMCPFVVARDLGRCVRTSCADRPGHVV